MNRALKVLIWGIGQYYNRFFNILKYWETMGEIKIVGVTDKNIPDISKIDDWKLYYLSEVSQLEVDAIIVMSDKYYLEIVSVIKQMGFDEKKTIPCKVLEIPYFNWKKYIQIRKSDLSIICNNCVGGILYNTLGLECKSPCKNLAIPDNSFLEIIQNLEYYMECELEFVRWQIDPHSKKQFPVMSLAGNEILCNHDIDIDKAKEKWNRRKQKINYDNILYMMYSESDTICKGFLEKTNHQRRVLFVPANSEIEDADDVYKLKLFAGQKEFYETVNSSASLGKNGLNYSILDMILGKKEYRYL